MRREITGDGIRWNETGRAGAVTGENGQPVTATPLAVLESKWNDGRIPVVGTIGPGLEINLFDAHRLDDRCYCACAIDAVGSAFGPTASETGPAGCLSLASDPDGSRWCRLNGSEWRDPCVFDEPDDAPVWAEIRAYQAAERGRGR